MTKKSPCALGVAVLLSCLITIPSETWAAPQAAGQRAGEVSRIIPAVNIARSAKTISAAAKTVVNWLDLVNTQVNARARIALDDGSVLNVGSEAAAAGAGAHLGVWGTVGIVVGAVGAGLGIGLTRGGGTQIQRGCNPNNPKACG